MELLGALAFLPVKFSFTLEGNVSFLFTKTVKLRGDKNISTLCVREVSLEAQITLNRSRIVLHSPAPYKSVKKSAGVTVHFGSWR